MNLITQKAHLSQNSTRVETFQKKQWLVAPAVLIVEGVLNGLYVPAHEIEIPTLSWNGRPVPLYHPDEGDGSANVPLVIDQSVMGSVFNARFENRSLKAELWLDMQKCAELGGEAAQVVADVQAGKVIELSTGYYCLVKQQAGVFNGIPYHGITHHILPDHVAILPSQVGACSVADGCGVNRNKQEERPMPKKDVNTVFHFEANAAMSHEDVKRLLRQALASTVQGVPGHVWIYIPDVYEDRVVYEIEVENAAGQVQAEMLQRPYTISENGMVELGDPVVKVIPVSSYQVVPGVPVFNAASLGAGFIQKVEAAVNSALSKIFPKEQSMKKNEMITQIKNAGFSCMSDEQLAQLPEAALEAMVAGLVGNDAEPTQDAQPTQPAAAAPAAQPTQPAAGDEMPAWAAALTQRLDQIGGAVAALQSNQKAAEKIERDQLIAGLVGNEACPLSDPADFAGMGLAQLQKMASAYQPTSYVGLPFAMANDAGQYDYADLSINVK